jgi:hypothetical protein
MCAGVSVYVHTYVCIYEWVCVSDVCLCVHVHVFVIEWVHLLVCLYVNL